MHRIPAVGMLGSEVKLVLGIMPYPGSAGGDLLDVLGVLAILLGGSLVYGFAMVGIYRRKPAAHVIRVHPRSTRKAA